MYGLLPYSSTQQWTALSADQDLWMVFILIMQGETIFYFFRESECIWVEKNKNRFFLEKKKEREREKILEKEINVNKVKTIQEWDVGKRWSHQQNDQLRCLGLEHLLSTGLHHDRLCCGSQWVLHSEEGGYCTYTQGKLTIQENKHNFIAYSNFFPFQQTQSCNNDKPDLHHEQESLIFWGRKTLFFSLFFPLPSNPLCALL